MNWSLALFMIPFVLVGLVIFVVLIGTIWSAIVQSKIGPTFIELAAHPLEPGQTCQALLSQAGPLTLKVFNVRMICTESARYVQGTTTRTDTKKVREFIVFEQFEVEVPGGTPFRNAPLT